MLGQNFVNTKYKTSLCRHFITHGNCALGQKCAFAHGQAELRGQNDPLPPQASMVNPTLMKMNGFPSNYKTVSCKYYETGGFCKNGVSCTFAHGDDDTKVFGANIPQQNPYMQYNMYGQPQMAQVQNNQQTSDDMKAQAMLYVISQIKQVIQTDQEAVQKILQAEQLIQQKDTQAASNLIQEIMADTKRTQQEMQVYQQSFQQAQTSLYQQNQSSIALQQQQQMLIQQQMYAAQQQQPQQLQQNMSQQAQMAKME